MYEVHYIESDGLATELLSTEGQVLDSIQENRAYAPSVKVKVYRMEDGYPRRQYGLEQQR